ncbi:hypothetical protein PCANC_10511, partial [Puccinia coronata f. sp. avenae]
KPNGTPLFNPPSSPDLSLNKTSDSDDLDLILNQPQVKSAEGNVIKGSVWTPIATGPSIPLAKVNKILNKAPLTHKPASIPTRRSRRIKQAKKKTPKKTAKTSRAKRSNAPRLLDSSLSPDNTNLFNDKGTSQFTMSSVTQPSNGPDYSNKGLSTKQLIAALDQEPTMELDDLFRMDPPLPPDTGIAPSLVNSREASRALELTRLTPVPAPIERQGVSSLPFVENSSNQPALSLLQANSTPQGQTQALEMSEEAETAANILDRQWSLFLKACSSNDTSLMQTTLTQAHSTQLLLQRLVGFDDMMRLLDNWSAKKELDKLEAEMKAPKKSGPAPMILDKELSKGTPQDNPNILGKNPEIKYLKLVPGGSNMPNAHLPPPPPLTNPLTTSHPPGNSPPFVPEMDICSPLSTQNQNSYYIPPHHLG